MKELYSDKIDDVSSVMEELWQEDNTNKSSLAQLWKRNVAFANGNQQITLNNQTALLANNQFFISQNQDTRAQMYITNEIEPIIRTLVSYMTRAKPVGEAFSPDTSEADMDRSRLAERIIEAKYVLDSEYMNSKLAAFWAMSVGSVFRKDYWDNSAGAQASIPVFDELGNEVIDPNTGLVMMQNQKTGDNAVAILTPMSIAFDWSVTDFKQLPWLQESYLMPVEWIRTVFDRNEPGYTGKAGQVVEGGSLGDSLTTLEEMKYATPLQYGTPTKVNGRDKALVRELYIEPSDLLPKGRMVIKAGDYIVYDSFNNGQDLGSPYFMEAQKVMWHPYSMFSFDTYVGRLLGKSLVEQVIAIQMRLNEINGSILENANTMAKPDWLAAEKQMKRGILRGGGGTVNVYTPRPDAPPPIRMQGVPLPEQFFKEKQMLIDQMVRIAGTNFAMQGQAPTGVTAAAALQLLLENASSQQSDLMHTWEEFHEDGINKKLRIIRNFNKLPNQQLINYLRATAKDALDEEIHSFVGEDLSDGINIKIQSGSMVPKSEQVRRQMYQDLAGKGLLGPIGEDSPRGARLREELLDKLGETGLDSEDTIEVKKSKWENDRVIRGMPVEVSPYDNSQIHIEIHTAKIQDPKFLERASDQVKISLDNHIKEHQQIELQAQQQAMQQAMEQQAMMAPAGPPEKKPAAPQEPSPAPNGSAVGMQ